MAGSVNTVFLLGRLGKDPEVRMTQGNKKIVNLRIATSDRWKDKQTGEMTEKTEWHSVVIFNENLANIAERYLHKGSECHIQGSLQTRKWTDQSGQERYTTEIVVGQFKGELTLVGGRGDSGSRDDGYGEPAPRGRPPQVVDLDDSIPF